MQILACFTGHLISLNNSVFIVYFTELNLMCLFLPYVFDLLNLEPQMITCFKNFAAEEGL